MLRCAASRTSFGRTTILPSVSKNGLMQPPMRSSVCPWLPTLTPRRFFFPFRPPSLPMFAMPMIGFGLPCRNVSRVKSRRTSIRVPLFRRMSCGGSLSTFSPRSSPRVEKITDWVMFRLSIGLSSLMFRLCGITDLVIFHNQKITLK